MSHNHQPTKRENLNEALIARQGLTDFQVEDIIDLHRELHHVFDEMESESNPERLRNLSLVVKQLEFDLQEAWHFDRDEDNHTWWFQVPHCQCPYLDNMDRVGTPYRVINPECVIHGETK